MSPFLAFSLEGVLFWIIKNDIVLALGDTFIVKIEYQSSKTSLFDMTEKHRKAIFATVYTNFCFCDKIEPSANNRLVRGVI